MSHGDFRRGLLSSIGWLPPHKAANKQQQQRQQQQEGPASEAQAEAAAAGAAPPTTTTTVAPPSMVAASTDDELRRGLQAFRGKMVCVQYSSQYCAHCHQMLPHFMENSRRYPGLGYVLAQVDRMAAGSVRFTPTYAFYDAKGQKVDEFWGVNAQRLEDRLWLHAANDTAPGLAQRHDQPAAGLSASALSGGGAS